MHFVSLLAAASTLGLVLSAPNRVAKRAGKMQWVGVNESGPEFGDGIFPGLYGKDYIWPTLSTYDTFIARGFNTFRINFYMERLIPNSMTGSLDPAYLSNLTEQVNYVTSRGAYAMIQPHNYGRYYKEVITDAAAFGKWWQTVATVYKDNPRVIWDTNNEFHTMSTALVVQLNQAAINGIRAAGAKQTINVEGNAWTGAWTWTTSKGTDGKTNADLMGSLTDPENKLVYQMHQYLDTDGSGTSPNCVSSTVGAERLVAATNWLRANKKIGLIGEFAGGVNAQCQTAIAGMLQYMNDNSDVWQGALWWAAGPWWGTYMYGLEPTNGAAYNAYMPILQSAFAGSGSGGTTTATSTTSSRTTSTTARTTSTATTTRTTSSPSPTGNCASKWGQCGGNGWNGPFCCVSGSTCQKSNDWYSQCL
ncbi:hypothetical protein WHR41_07291 [Cladosporium halotolerans]|uniref:cellulase n=1 Tax=Cladosporium halotolerans TaxID=1052096 RepID=A0AB34KJW2_9PEZI